MIYCDYAATTPIDPHVAEVMNQYLTLDGVFGNPSSTSHSFGQKAKLAVEQARSEVADLINASPEEIIWTSGATESDNLALFGAARFHARRGKHIITLKTEHRAVLDACIELEREGFEVTYLDVEANGLLDIKKLEAAIRDDTILLSVMLVNNEIGVVQDVQMIGALAREHGIVFHVDGAQACGKMIVDVKAMNIDLFSMSAHKVYGPKGIGALFVSRDPKVRLQALQYGGGQERGLRSGTLPTHQIVAMGVAFSLAKTKLAKECVRLQEFRDRLLSGLMALGDVFLNGSQTQCVPGIVNVSFNFIDGEALMTALTDVAVSSGSACTTESLEPSYVLKAIGVNDLLASSAVRFSVGRFTTEEEIDRVVAHLAEQVRRLRELSPLS